MTPQQPTTDANGNTGEMTTDALAKPSALELAEYLEDFSARVLLHGVSPASVQLHYDKCHAAAQLLRALAAATEELATVRKQANDEFDTIITRNTELERENRELRERFRDSEIETVLGGKALYDLRIYRARSDDAADAARNGGAA